MLKTEIYRILSRKLVLLALTLTVSFSFFYGRMSVGEEIVVDGGKLYRHGNAREAIARDKEIAAPFAGYLTEETVRDIWEQYGSPCYLDYGVSEEVLLSEAEAGRSYNYCNRFAARLFGRGEAGEDGRTVYRLREDLSGSRLLKGDYYFGYVGRGWLWYWDSFLVIFILTCLVIIVALAPTFSEDYSCRTAGCILPTVRGRLSLWRTRILAGFLFSSVLYWLTAGILFFQQAYFYGTDALRVSCGFTNIGMYWQEDAAPLGAAMVMLHLCGWIAVLVLTLVVQAVSAACRQSFSSVLWSLAAYIGPFALLRLVLSNLPLGSFPMGKVNEVLQKIIYGMPFSYSGMMLNAPPEGRRFLSCAALTAAVLAALLGARAWCRHQVKG